MFDWQKDHEQAVRRGLVAAALCLLPGCTVTPAPVEPIQPIQQVPLSTGYSSSSSSGSGLSSADYGSGKGLSVPQRTRLTDPTRLSLRPDLYTLSFAVREQRATSHAALEAARATSDRVSAELLRAIGPSARAQVNGLTLTRVTRDSEQLGVLAVVAGTVEVRLTDDQDFWVRSRLFTTLVESTQRIAEAAGLDQDAMHAVSFEPPRAEVSDPEAYRAELLVRWVKRVREFATAAEAGTAPLFVRDCVPPGAVVQATRSFDEVSLELAITCRVDTRGTDSAPAQD